MIFKLLGKLIKLGLMIAVILIVIGLAYLWFSEWNVSRVIKSANHCETSAECITMRFNCPLPCDAYVNINDTQGIRFYTSMFGILHSKTCVQECTIAKAPVCVNKKCVASP